MDSALNRGLGVTLAGVACWLIATTLGLGSGTAAGILVVYGWAIGVGLLAWKAARGPGRAWAIIAVVLSAVMVFLALLAVIVFILAAEGPDGLGEWIQFVLYVVGAFLMMIGSVQLATAAPS